MFSWIFFLYGLKKKKAKTIPFGPKTSWQINGERNENSDRNYFGGSKITVDDDCSLEIKTLVPWKESYDKPRQCIKKQKYHFTNNEPSSQSYGFPSSHVKR